MSLLKKASLLIGIILLLFVVYLLIVVFNFTSKQIKVEPVNLIEIPTGAVDRYTEAISIRTISFEDKMDFDSSQFLKFNDFLLNNYPLINEKLEHKTFNEFSHLYLWKGKKSELKPIVLMAHIDVVPIASPRAWTVHPFTEGLIKDTIYGRGAMDCKFGLLGILESTEQLLSEGFEPERDIYLSFGHDEEILGNGAVQISEYLKDSNIEVEFVLDEGLAITDGLVPGMDSQVALIGIAEKGFMTVELSVALPGGHSSTPAKETAIDVLSKAVSKLKENPLPRNLNPVVDKFLDYLGPEMTFFPKIFVANRGIFKPFLLNDYEKSNNGNALIRTTTSPTIFEAGIKENVIPTVAKALVNFRIIPGETQEDVLSHVQKVINDNRINIEVYTKGSGPSAISPIDNKSFNSIQQSILEIYPQVKIAPSLVLGGTDSKNFSKLSKNIYRFSPYIINTGNNKCFHGINERVPKVEYENGIRFYRQVIINGSGF